jgi:hypothetical protein
MEVPPRLRAVQPMAHRVQIHHDFLTVLGQTTGSPGQPASLDRGRIVRHLVAASASVVGQLQAVQRGRRRQGNAAIGGIDPLLSQGIGLVAGGGQQGVQPQPLVIINVFITQG